MKEPIKLLEPHKLEMKKSDHRVKDEVCAIEVASHLAEIAKHLKAAADTIVDTGADLAAVRSILNIDADVIENFFQVNMLLKGLLMLVEGEEWEKSVESAKHDYTQGTITFLRLVHNANFNVNPPEPPKVVNIE